MTVFIPAVLPLPFLPMKAFVLCAGALGIRPLHFLGVMAAGRVARYGGLAYLAHQLGENSVAWLGEHKWHLALFALLLAALPAVATALPPATVAGLGLLAAAVLAGAGLLLEGRVLRRLMGWLARWPLTRPLSLAGDTWLGQTYQVITSVGWRAVGRALLISLVFNLSIVWSNWLAARALGLEVPPDLVAVALPVISATLLVPVSISGFGVREGVVVALLGQAGVGAAVALALSLAVIVIVPRLRRLP